MTIAFPSGGATPPFPLRPLVGREQDIGALGALLRREAVRLVTLTGPRGAGKSRLSLQIAAELQSSFPDGVVFVMLAAVQDPALALAAIGRALGAEDGQRQSTRQAVAAFLRQRRLLLVLDTVDQALIDGRLLTDLLAEAPGLKLLVCNRRPLGLAAEHEFTLAPLTAPAASQRPALDSLAKYTAIQLFVERARAAAPGFELRPEQAPAMIDICAHLDGLPLAIELVAAQSRRMSPSAIWESLGPRLSFQSPGARDSAARQQVMRAILDWAVGLLDAPARRLLGELAAFAGAADPEALAVVSQRPAAKLAAGLAELERGGLIARAAEAGDERWTMLDSVREHVRGLMEAAGGAREIDERFSDYCLELAERAEPELRGAEQRAWLDRLEREADNLHAAIQRAVAGGRPEIAVRFGAALWRFWLMRGYVSLGRYWLETALAADRAASRERRAKALNGLGTLASVQGDYPRASVAFTASLKLQQALGDRQGVGFLLNNLGLVASEQGEFDEARALLRESLAIWRELGDRRQQAQTLSNLGAMANDLGDPAEARGLLRESLAIWRELGDSWGAALALTNLGETLAQGGGAAEAVPLLEEGLALSERVGDVRLASTARTLLGASLLAQGESGRAGLLLADSLRQCQEIGDRRGLAAALAAAAEALAERGHGALAAGALAAARDLRDAIGAALPPAEQERQLRLEEALAAAGPPPSAAPLDQTLAQVRAELGAGGQDESAAG